MTMRMLQTSFINTPPDGKLDLDDLETNFMALSTCLIRFEGFLKSNKKLLLELIR